MAPRTQRSHPVDRFYLDDTGLTSAELATSVEPPMPNVGDEFTDKASFRAACSVHAAALGGFHVISRRDTDKLVTFGCHRTNPERKPAKCPWSVTAEKAGPGTKLWKVARRSAQHNHVLDEQPKGVKKGAATKGAFSPTTRKGRNAQEARPVDSVEADGDLDAEGDEDDGVEAAQAPPVPPFSGPASAPSSIPANGAPAEASSTSVDEPEQPRRARAKKPIDRDVTPQASEERWSSEEAPSLEGSDEEYSPKGRKKAPLKKGKRKRAPRVDLSPRHGDPNLREWETGRPQRSRKAPARLFEETAVLASPGKRHKGPSHKAATHLEQPAHLVPSPALTGSMPSSASGVQWASTGHTSYTSSFTPTLPGPQALQMQQWQAWQAPKARVGYPPMVPVDHYVRDPTAGVAPGPAHPFNPHAPMMPPPVPHTSEVHRHSPPFTQLSSSFPGQPMYPQQQEDWRRHVPAAQSNGGWTPSSASTLFSTQQQSQNDRLSPPPVAIARPDHPPLPPREAVEWVHAPTGLDALHAAAQQQFDADPAVFPSTGGGGGADRLVPPSMHRHPSGPPAYAQPSAPSQLPPVLPQMAAGSAAAFGMYPQQAYRHMLPVFTNPWSAPAGHATSYAASPPVPSPMTGQFPGYIPQQPPAPMYPAHHHHHHHHPHQPAAPQQVSPHFSRHSSFSAQGGQPPSSPHDPFGGGAAGARAGTSSAEEMSRQPSWQQNESTSE